MTYHCKINLELEQLLNLHPNVIDDCWICTCVDFAAVAMMMLDFH